MNHLKRALADPSALWPKETAQDSLFLVIVMFSSCVLYIGGLGFYSDDWAFIGSYIVSPDQSLPGFIRGFWGPLVFMRPVQAVYLPTLYWIFGTHPIGYHFVNSAFLICGILLLYLVLRELDLERLPAVAIALIYGSLPHYSTNRFWYATFQATLSMTLYFLSLYADLRALRSNHAQRYRYQILSVAALLGSTLSYEVFLPLFFLNPVLLFHERRRLEAQTPKNQMDRRELVRMVCGNLLVLIAVIGFKALTTVRFTGFPRIGELAYVAVRALHVNYAVYGLGLPLVVGRIIRGYPDWRVFTLGGGGGVIVFSYLVYIARQSGYVPRDLTRDLRFLAWGFLVFAVGYSIFLTNDNVSFTPTGIDNRTAIAGSVGVALSFAGALSIAASFFRSRPSRGNIFIALVALTCSCGFLINNTIASFWERAYHLQLEVLSDIHQQIPSVPARSSFILDGVCPYDGPGIVFECWWDMTGALRFLYRDSTIVGDIVTPKMKIEREGLSTTIYGERSFYPYGQLMIYNFVLKKTYTLTNEEDAWAYFAKYHHIGSGNDCPAGEEGQGIPIF